MRIISGTAGRRPIKVPRKVARPTTDRTREAIFSILGDLVRGAVCADLFAGSGALGLEALSRGAESCVFVDSDRGSVRTIRENLTELGLQGGEVVQSEVGGSLVRYAGKFDLVFADPPYVKKAGDRDFVSELLDGGLTEACKRGAHFVAEAPAGRVALGNDRWELLAQKSYGSCGVSVYRRI